jgi:hypothetical protein
MAGPRAGALLSDWRHGEDGAPPVSHPQYALRAALAKSRGHDVTIEQCRILVRRRYRVKCTCGYESAICEKSSAETLAESHVVISGR